MSCCFLSMQSTYTQTKKQNIFTKHMATLKDQKLVCYFSPYHDSFLVRKSVSEQIWTKTVNYNVKY